MQLMLVCQMVGRNWYKEAQLQNRPPTTGQHPSGRRPPTCRNATALRRQRASAPPRPPSPATSSCAARTKPTKTSGREEAHLWQSGAAGRNTQGRQVGGTDGMAAGPGAMGGPSWLLMPPTPPAKVGGGGGLAPRAQRPRQPRVPCAPSEGSLEGAPLWCAPHAAVPARRACRRCTNQ